MREQGPNGRKILLHICCAPDATVPLADLAAEGWRVTGFFYGSNIHPGEEYQRRLAALLALYAARGGEPPAIAPYLPDAWFAHMERLGLLGEPEGGRRCEACFALQLEAAAKEAERRGCSHLCTTLTISPHKDAPLLLHVGERAAAAHGLSWEARVWRKRDGFLRSVKMSRELGLYRQNYCGCLPSRG